MSSDQLDLDLDEFDLDLRIGTATQGSIHPAADQSEGNPCKPTEGVDGTCIETRQWATCGEDTCPATACDTCPDTCPDTCGDTCPDTCDTCGTCEGNITCGPQTCG